MSGRIRDKTGINYPFTFETSKLSNLKWDLQLNEDIENGFNIIVLTHQPGIGKTTNVLKYMEENPSTFYFTDRHKAIYEHTKGWGEDKIDFAHWRGFSRICETEGIKNIYKQYHLNPKDIFDSQNWRDKSKDSKSYYSQFEKRNRVFAPFNYLNSSHFYEAKPEIVFIDERISQLEEFTFKIDKLRAFLEITGAPPKYLKFVDEWSPWFFLDESISSQILDAYKSTIIESLEEENNTNLKILQEFNPHEFINYIQWGRIYNYNFDKYSIPFYYHAFKALTEGIPLVILDASFNINLFHYFLETYNGEYQKLNQEGFKETKVNVKIYNSNVVNNDSIIYRMRPRGAWSRASIKSEMKKPNKDWISRDIRNIMDIFGSSNVGVISFKEYGEICQTFGFNMEYFGGLRGSNILEDKLVLVILGGWFPPPPKLDLDEDEIKEDTDYLDDLVLKYFYRDISKNDYSEVKMGAPEEVETSHTILLKKGIARFTTDKKLKESETPADYADNHPISMINTLYNDEMYQAFHRNRALRYPRIIFAYCWFPEPKAVFHYKYKPKEMNMKNEHFIDYNLRKEFGGNVKKILNNYIDKDDYKDERKFFDWLKTQYSQGKVEGIIREFEKGSIRGISPSPTVIASKYKIHKGSGEGLDNKFIEEFKMMYEKLKERAEEKGK